MPGYSPDSPGEENVIRGIGMFGVGGAMGPGNAAKAGYISVLTLVAIGDASIEAAKKDGGITKVHHVDWEVENILGIIGKYKVTVYGE